MTSLKHLKLKIGNINSVKKITEAMKSSSSSLLKKYRNESDVYFEYMNDLATTFNAINYKYKPNNKGNNTVVVISNDKGLCGSANYNVSKYFDNFINQNNIDLKIDHIIFVGCKSMYYFNYNLNKFDKIKDAEISKVKNNSKPSEEQINEIFKLIENSNNCYFIFNHFKSMTSVVASEIDVCNVNFNNELYKNFNLKNNQSYKKNKLADELLFEPSKKEIYNHFQELFLKSIIRFSLVESYLSFQSSRAMAMESASKNASGMLHDAKREYNKIRQYKITKELIEIISAKQSLENN